VLLGLLLVEVLAFSLYFDVQPLDESNVLMARIAGHGSAILWVLAVAAVAFVLVGRRYVPTLFVRWTELAQRNRAFGWALALHLVAAGWFVVQSSSVLQVDAPPATAWQIWRWAAAGGLSLAAWLVAFAPLRFWAELRSLECCLLLIASLLIGTSVTFLGLFARELWIPLGDGTMFVCARLLELVSNDVVCEPARRILGTAGFNVEIGAACSGYEGIGLVAGTLSLFLWLFRGELRFPQALVLLPIGVVGIWLCNALRIVALVLLGAHGSPKLAVDAFHSQAGWIAFAVITLAMCAIALHVPWFARPQSSGDEAGAQSSRPTSDTAAYLMPLLAMIAVAMVAAAFSLGFDRLYPAKAAAGVAMLWYYRAAYRGLARDFSWAAVVNGIVVFALWMALETFSSQSGSSLAAGLESLPRPWAIAWLTVRVLGSVLVIPVVEELAFRGYLLRRFTSRDFESVAYCNTSWWAVAISSVLFGLLHGRWLAGSLAGLAYALAARRRDQLSDAIVAHAVTNGLLAVYVLATQSWHLWA
jgi:exosortase E/protease (VPEID-CTERM system)